MAESLLLTPVTVNKTFFKNRVILPSMVTHYAAPNGEVTDRLVHYHEARARGGVGLNILEATSVDDGGRSYLPGLSIAADGFVKGLRRLTDAIHAAGGMAGIQLHHAGRLAKPEASGRPVPLVSYVPGRTEAAGSVVLDAADIARLVRAFADAAGRAVAAGFDVIEIHGAHGYLLAQFMSPLFNRRQDEYGGSFAGRMRFPVEVIRAVRNVVGPDYPLFFRCSVEEFVPGGIDSALARDIALTVAAHGIDLFNVSVGLAETNEFTGPPPRLPDAWNAERAGAVKAALAGPFPRVRVAVAGRIVDRASADAVLSSGRADMVVMGRALIADPDLPAKLARGGDKDVLPCIGCNEGCVGRLRERKAVECAVNPRAGREALYLDEIPAPAVRRVLVAGGGPAGLEAALTAARRGHAVTLLEQTDRLGGLLNTAALPPHKAILNRLTAWYERQLRQAGVDIRLCHEATAAELAALHPDALFVATGSDPVEPRWLAGTAHLTAAAALRGAGIPAAGASVLVLGGGLVGCETAEFLALAGHAVTILELRAELAPDMQARARKLLLRSLRELGVAILTETEVLAVADDGRVSVRDVYGRERALPRFDALVAALGYRPRNGLSAELAAAGLPFVPLGDCVRPGKIMSAVHGAHAAARAL